MISHFSFVMKYSLIVLALLILTNILSCCEGRESIHIPLPFMAKTLYPELNATHPCKTQDWEFMFQQNETWGACSDTVLLADSGKKYACIITFYKNKNRNVISISANLFCSALETKDIIRVYASLLKAEGWFVTSKWMTTDLERNYAVLGEKSGAAVSISINNPKNKDDRYYILFQAGEL